MTLEQIGADQRRWQEKEEDPVHEMILQHVDSVIDSARQIMDGLDAQSRWLESLPEGQKYIDGYLKNLREFARNPIEGLVFAEGVPTERLPKLAGELEKAWRKVAEKRRQRN